MCGIVDLKASASLDAADLRAELMIMRACSRIVTLAIIALIAMGGRAYAFFPPLQLGQSSEEQLTNDRADSTPALAAARPVRTTEPGTRKAPCLAVLPGLPLLPPTLSYRAELVLPLERLRSLPLLPRTSRGPPFLTL